MLDTLLKFGSHRVDYFDQTGSNPQAFAFYVRGGMDDSSHYSHEAKYQLYSGLAVIRSTLGLQNLAAVYIDINTLENIRRPAYEQLKHDLCVGMFKRVFVFNGSALLGCPCAEADLTAACGPVDGFELISCDEDAAIFVQGQLEHIELMSV
jgi:hypothetical protein